MIQLQIDKNSRSYSPKEDWQRFDREIKNFSTLQDAKDYLRETYGKSKRVPLFQEDEGGDFQNGYVYGYRAGWGGDHWLEQHWVSFLECTRMEVN